MIRNMTYNRKKIFVFGSVAIALGLALSLVVYPFALYKNINQSNNA